MNGVTQSTVHLLCHWPSCSRPCSTSASKNHMTMSHMTMSHMTMSHMKKHQHNNHNHYNHHHNNHNNIYDHNQHSITVISVLPCNLFYFQNNSFCISLRLIICKMVNGWENEHITSPLFGEYNTPIEKLKKVK